MIPIVLVASVLGGAWLVCGVSVVSLLALREVDRLIEAHGAIPSRWVGIAAVVSLPAVVYRGDPTELLAWVTASILAALVVELGSGRITGALANAAGTLFGIFYVGWLLAHVIALRHLADHPALAAQQIPGMLGMFLVITTIASTAGCDAGAYFVGRAFGRHKLSPTVSPGKSVEGALGGLCTAVAFGLIAHAVFGIESLGGVSSLVSVPVLVGLSLAVGVAGIVGDLLESLLKRDAEVKDAGTLIPGSGGVLDRIDSGLLAFPTMYYLVLVYLIWS